MTGSIVTVEDAEDSLSFIEGALSQLGSGDEYYRAMLKNQEIMVKSLLNLNGVSGNNHVVAGNVEIDNLPKGLAGTATQEIANGSSGEAVFNISGSSFRARVEASGDIDENESVVVIDDGNYVKPSPNIRDTLNVQVSGNQGNYNTEYFSSETKIEVTSEEEESKEWGWPSQRISVYDFDNPFYIAFKNQEDDDRLIYLTPAQDPFSITMQATDIHYRKPEALSEPASFRLLALR